MTRHRQVDDAPHLAGAVLSPEGGGGAGLRGSVPAHPAGAVLLLHGGAEASRVPVHWWRAPVLRMTPFAGALERRSGGRLAVIRLKNRVRGWNGTRLDPVVDALWALERLRSTLPGVPVAVVGHSMGGRVALRLADRPGVAAVAALAPWVEGDARRPGRGVPVLLVHGARDRVTDPRRTALLADRYTAAGVDVRHVEVPGESHAMLRRPGFWHDTVADFVTEALTAPTGPGRTS